MLVDKDDFKNRDELARISAQAGRLGYTLVKRERIQTLGAQKLVSFQEFEAIEKHDGKGRIEEILRRDMGRAIGDKLLTSDLISVEQVNVEYSRGFRATVRVIANKEPEGWL